MEEEFLLFDNTMVNPNHKFVSKILDRIYKNDGYCPCNQGDTLKEDTKCPCKKYREEQYCCCTLYVKR